MLTLTILGTEVYNEETEEFSTVGDVIIEMEHSLVSLSKWESKHQKSFLSSAGSSGEEMLDYLRCMIVSKDVDEDIINSLTTDDIKKIQEYIDSPNTATTFYEYENKKPNNQVVTSELIYYWMIAANIPFECQYWHLNRLLTLIRICGIKNSKQKKIPKRELLSRNQAINAKRKAELGTAG